MKVAANPWIVLCLSGLLVQAIELSDNSNFIGVNHVICLACPERRLAVHAKTYSI